MLGERIGFVGAGRLATVLAHAWANAGERILGVASRSDPSARALADGIEDCLVFDSPQQLADHADVVFLTVPDDAIAAVAASVRWRPGQAVVHCSGAAELTVLDTAAQAGAYIGGFHPLQIFSDPEVAGRLLAGSCVAIEAASPLAEELDRLAGLVGCRPLALPTGGRVRYHMAANYAASGLLALLKHAEDLWQSCGMPRDTALPALMPLAQGALASASRLGLAHALSGPAARGDVGVVQRHIREAEAVSPQAAQLYRLLGSYLVSLARERGSLSQDAVNGLERTLQNPTP